jgi:hypothetical protein
MHEYPAWEQEEEEEAVAGEEQLPVGPPRAAAPPAGESWRRAFLDRRSPSCLRGSLAPGAVLRLICILALSSWRRAPAAAPGARAP